METIIQPALIAISSLFISYTLTTVIVNRENKINLTYLLSIFGFSIITVWVCIVSLLLTLRSFNLFNTFILFSLISLVCAIYHYRTKARILISDIIYERLDLLVIFLSMLFLVPTAIGFSEWFVGGMDAGNYVTIAYSNVETGSFVNELDYSLSDFECNNAFVCDGQDYKPHYLPVYPLLLSAGLLLSNTYGIILVQLLITFFVIISFYTTVKLLFKRKIAIVSVLLLLCMPLQILYSREVMSEILGQLFLFLSLILLFECIKNNSRKFAFLSFISLAMLLLTKLDSVLVVAPIGLIIFGYNYINQKSTLFRFTPFTTLIASVFYQFLALKYTGQIITRNAPVSAPAILILIFVFCSFVSSFIPFDLLRKNAVVKFADRNIKKIVLTIFILISMFIFYRLLLGLDRYGTENFNHDYVNILRILYYISVPLLLGAIGGYIVLFKKERKIIVLLISGFILVTFINLILSQHSYPLTWWARRYLLFLIPVVTILSSYLIVNLVSRLTKNRILILIPFGVFFVYFFLQFSLPAFIYKNNSGLNQQVVEFEKRFNDDSIILIPSTSVSDKRIYNSAIMDTNHSIRIYSNKKPLTLDKINNISRDNINKSIYVINSSRQLINTLTEAKVKLENCFEETIQTSYYYEEETICTKGLFCNWVEATEVKNAFYKFNVCRLSLNSIN